MGESIIEQVSRIEAEADGIVRRAQQSARELSDSVADEVAAFLQEREEAFRQKAAELKQQLRGQTDGQLADVDRAAREAMARLESLDSDTVVKAVNLVLEHLRKDG